MLPVDDQIVLKEIAALADNYIDDNRPERAFLTRDLVDNLGWSPGRVQRLIGDLLRDKKAERVHWRGQDILGRNIRIVGFRLIDSATRADTN